MVSFLKKKNALKIADIVYFIFHIQEFFTHIIEVNKPSDMPALYATWHGSQMCIYGISPQEKLNILVSRSRDGDMISKVLNNMGFKTIRGSKGKKGAVEATMQMITALKNGENCAMMVDGPRGPVKVVKDGVVKVAKMAGVPIVPVYWYSTNFNFVQFPSWDKLRMPILDVNLVNLYGEPIYVNEDSDIEEVRQKIQASLEELERKIPEAYNEVYRFGRWKRKRSDSSQYKWNP
ncbi:DUF374 domain-containing protein [bacterium]|nr:DUF374 domain-containing protein [bacterium]